MHALRRLAIVLFVSVAFAQTVEAPKISPEQRAKFWRVQAEYLAAAARFQQAKYAMDAMQVELDKVCAPTKAVLLPDGEPGCAAQK
jgi:Holliday junction resolvase-like predicted endonuclease